MIDISKIEYEAELITESGAVYPLRDGLQELMWEEQENTLAQRAKIVIANTRVGNNPLINIIKINCIIRIFSTWGSPPRTLLFEGTVWDWQYSSNTSGRLWTITAYDPMIRLQQSKDFKYFSAGLNTQTIIGEICSDWNIPFEYKWEQSITHEKKVFNNMAISDMINELLKEVYQQTGVKYIAYFRDGKLQIIGYGNNSIIYRFGDRETISTDNKLTINNLVTRVKIIGKANDEGRSPVEAVIDGDLRFGVLQEIILRDSDKSIADAKAEAASTLKERGKPEEQITVHAPDVPFLRRGDEVYIWAGNLQRYFYILGISHNASRKDMTMSLRRR